MADPNIASVVVAVGALLGLLSLLGGLRAGTRRRIIENTPTCKTTGIFIGLVEVKGTAEAEQPLRSYLSEMACVHYAWTIEEEWTKTVTETRTDSKGRTYTETHVESGWETVTRGGETIPFFLKDDCGTVLVQPDGAKLDPQRVLSLRCGRGNPIYYGKGPVGAILHSTGIRRFTEVAIPLHTPLYVIGHARERQDIIAPEIAADKSAAMFLITTRTERQVSGGLNTQFWCLGILAVLLATAGMAVHDHLLRMDVYGRIPVFIGVAGVGVGAWMLGWAWMVYNSMIALNQRVSQGWANVDVQLKRRADLIPNLVQIVKGYRDYEQTLQQELARLRAQAAATAPGQPGPDPQGCRQTIVAIAERYPELKADQHFLSLQRQLADTEERIALARAYFNDIVAFYNRRLAIIPDALICSLAGLKPRQFIAAEEFERQAVAVKLT